MNYDVEPEMNPRAYPSRKETKMASEELKPCPFCGGEARYFIVTEDNTNEISNLGGEGVECIKCGSSTNLMFPIKDDVKNLVVEKWNKRHSSLTKQEQKLLGKIGGVKYVGANNSYYLYTKDELTLAVITSEQVANLIARLLNEANEARTK